MSLQSSKRARRKDLRNYRPVNISSVPGKVTEQLILDDISKQVDKKVIRSSQHGFVKGRSCFTNLVAFYDVMTGRVDEGRAVHVMYLDFGKAFNAVTCNILYNHRKPRQL